MTRITNLNSIVNVSTLVETGLVKDAFIKYVFFLPPEVLSSPEWNIEPMRIVAAEEWFASAHMPEAAGAHIHYDPSRVLCIFAKKLGVSVRRHWLTGETFIVVKLWYEKG